MLSKAATAGALLILTFLAHAQSPLDLQLKAIAAAHHGDVALYAENLTTHQTAALAPDTVVQTASTIKLAILEEALEQIRAGRVHFADPITLTKADQVPGSGVLLFFDTPLNLTFKDVLTFMIVMSDNAATNLAIDHLGLANINARIATLGLANTYLYKKVFTPVTPGTTLPADFKQFGLGKTTPREIATLMARIARCDFALPSQSGDSTLCDAALHCSTSSSPAPPSPATSTSSPASPLPPSPTRPAPSTPCAPTSSRGVGVPIARTAPASTAPHRAPPSRSSHRPATASPRGNS